MSRKIILAFLVLVIVGMASDRPAPAVAQDPIHVGFPPCEGGELGFWQPFVREGKVWIAIVTMVVEYEDPAVIRCWLGNAQAVRVVNTRKS